MATDRCDWQVIGVFDPDGTGQDFAYTNGLHRRGLPELHVWARPTDGFDPGGDFMLSARDCMHLLNMWADELITGTLTVGDTRIVTMDGGLTTGVFTASGPISRREAEAFTVPDEDVQVITFKWELRRSPEPVNLH